MSNRKTIKGEPIFSTDPFTMDRTKAVKNNLQILRVGHPFISALSKYVGRDDRGVAYAIWRMRPNIQLESGVIAHIYFRFDFVLEAQFSNVHNWFKNNPRVSIPAINRQLDRIFPPRSCTIWIDEEFNVVLNPPNEVLQPYRKGLDVSITHKEERWARVEKLGLYADWKKFCDMGLRIGNDAARKQTNLEEAIEIATSQLVTRLNRQKVQLHARRGALDPIRLIEEQREYELQEEVYEAMKEAIKQSIPRLDSVGVLFLSDKSIFEDDSSE